MYICMHLSHVGWVSLLSCSGRACAWPCLSCCPRTSEPAWAQTPEPGYEAPSEHTRQKEDQWHEHRGPHYDIHFTALHTPCFCLSGRLQSSGELPGTSECGNNDLEGLGSMRGREQTHYWQTCLTCIHKAAMQTHTSFFMVFSLSDALSIRLASMKSLYLSVRALETFRRGEVR